MSNIQPTQPGYAQQALPQSAPNRPSSPFQRQGQATQPGQAYGQDQVQSQPIPRGIQPNLSLLRDEQSTLSPFHRPNGEKVDFLERPQIPTVPGNPNDPGAPANQGNTPIIFTFPKDIPQGPAQANIEQIVQQEIQTVQAPEQALQLIDAHAQSAVAARETANRFTWGARYYAVQAAELAEQTLAQWPQMDQGQRQVFMSKIQEYRDQAVSMLNTSRQHAIGTYNEALKANLIYNHFFTTTGGMIESLNDQNRDVVKHALDQAWARWDGTFQKEWQGQVVEAKGIVHIVDETTTEVTNHLHRMNSVLSQLQ